MDKSKIIKGVGIVAAGLAIAGVGAIGGVSYTDSHYVNPALNQIKVLQQELSAKPKVITKTEVITNEVPVEVTVEKEVIKEVEVPVDNGNLDKVMDFVKDEIDEDLDVDYIIFETESKMIAEKFIEDEMVNLLKDEDYFDNGELLDNYRTSEVSVKTIYDPYILDRDFDDKDVEIQYEVKVKAKEDGEDKEYFYFKVTCPFENGNFDSEDVSIDFLDE